MEIRTPVQTEVWPNDGRPPRYPLNRILDVAEKKRIFFINSGNHRGEKYPDIYLGKLFDLAVSAEIPKSRPWDSNTRPKRSLAEGDGNKTDSDTPSTKLYLDPDNIAVRVPCKGILFIKIIILIMLCQIRDDGLRSLDFNPTALVILNGCAPIY